MRWFWIDRVVTHEPGKRLVALKNISLAEEHLHDHFAARPERNGRPALPAQPLMPASLILEGVAQTGGILVGAANQFREKVVLAKIASAELRGDVGPGQTLRYDVSIERLDPTGAGTIGLIDLLDPMTGTATRLGEVEMMYSHLDQNRAGRSFPAENFVFGENFRVILAQLGIE